MKVRRLILVLTLIVIPLLAGAQCAAFFSSGGGSDDDEEHRDGLTVIVVNGYLGEAPTKGVGFTSGSISGVTDEEGRFQYQVGHSVRFYLGDIPLGGEVEGDERITAKELALDGNPVEATNIRRLLRSLDADPGDEAITIPDSVRAGAVLSNEDVYWAIEYLDFADEEAFVNAASQLVSVLTEDYPFTAALVDAQAIEDQAPDDDGTSK
jgi:hypothetical protein